MAEHPVSGEFGHYRLWMRSDWLPASSAALVTGATGLFYGAQTLPRPDGEGAVLRHLAAEADGVVSPAVVLLVAATALVFGLPALFALFGRRGLPGLGMVGLVLLAFGAITMAGFAQHLLMVRPLVADASLSEGDLLRMMDQPIVSGLLLTGYGAFWAGELCVAAALYRSGRSPNWIPTLLVLNAVTGLVVRVFALDALDVVPALCMAAGLAGAGVQANRNSQPDGVSSRDIAAQHAREHQQAPGNLSR